MIAQDNREKSVIGEVYSSSTGNTLAEESEYNIGWLQVSRTERVKVMYKRISHSSCAWQEVPEKNDDEES